MSDDKLNRRQFLERAAMLGATALGASALVSACEPSSDSGQGEAPGGPSADQGGGEGFSCSDQEALAELNDGQIQRREAQNYTDKTNTQGEQCDNCLHWQEPAAGEDCGGCAVLPGPIHPEGWCNLWQAAAA